MRRYIQAVYNVTTKEGIAKGTYIKEIFIKKDIRFKTLNVVLTHMIPKFVHVLRCVCMRLT